MSGFDLGATMDAVAQVLLDAAIVPKAYGWPNGAALPVSAIVGYPEEIEFDAVFGRGSDRAVLPFFVVCGGLLERPSRDVAARYVGGAKDVKDAMDGDLQGAVQTCRTTDGQVDRITLGGVEFLAVKFSLEIYS